MCKSKELGEVSPPSKENNDGGSGEEVSVLEKERQEKIEASSKFYWAHDEEPHRRR